MDEWQFKVCPTIGHHASLTYQDIQREGHPQRPLDFPSPIVHRGTRKTVIAYDPKRGEYHKLKNVLIRSRGSGGSKDYIDVIRSPNNNTNIRRSGSGEKDAGVEHVGYYLRRKMATTVYGGVYKGMVLRQRNLMCGEDAVIQEAFRDRNTKSSLSSIMEDLEMDDKSSKENVTNRFNPKGSSTLWEITGQYVIIKTSSWSKLRRLRGKHLEDPIKEIQCMQLIGNYNSHFVSHIAAMQDEHLLYNVMQYCEDGDLYGVVMSEINNNGRVDESRARIWFRQLLLALHYLQQKGVCHRDMKLENIMVHKEEIKIVDFGLSLRVPYKSTEHDGAMTYVTDVSEGSNRLLMTAQGQGSNLEYMSPEVLGKEKYFDGFAHDLWAVGVILYVLLVGHKPFHLAHVSDIQFLQLSENDSLKENLDYWDINLSTEACDLLQNMLRHDPRQRLTLADVMKHKWVRGVNEVEKIDSNNSTRKNSTMDDNKVGKSKWFKKKRDKCNSKNSKR